MIDWFSSQLIDWLELWRLALAIARYKLIHYSGHCALNLEPEKKVLWSMSVKQISHFTFTRNILHVTCVSTLLKRANHSSSLTQQDFGLYKKILQKQCLSMKYRKNRKKLHQENFICCWGVKLFLLKDVTITAATTAIVTTVTIWFFDFCQNLSFWVL